MPVARPAGRPRDPLVVWQRVEAPLAGRLYGLLFALIVLAAFALAVRLSPSRDHLGTHRQLGLPPCGFLAITGFPCPTCGMTTACAFLVRGQVGEAFRSSVLGCLLAAGAAAFAAASLGCAITGLYPSLNTRRVDATRLVVAAALLFVVSWGLKIVLGLLDGTLPAR